MSVASFPLGGAAISECVAAGGVKKPPSKRQVAAKPDATVVPEPR